MTVRAPAPGSIYAPRVVTARRRLSVSDHDRAVAGMTYVYPVVSRRAGGVSIGVNLNPNDACNWRCVYCQVPNLTRGKGPAIDMAKLERELGAMLDDVVKGDFLERAAPENARRLVDVALSGNGEPTTSPQFSDVVGAVGRALDAVGLRGKLNVVLITNGSMLHRPSVRRGVVALAELGGEVWFKLDTATSAGLRSINGFRGDPAQHLARLGRSAELCPTWVQTCMFARHGAPPSELEQDAYLGALGAVVADGVPLRGVLLYTIARPSMQPEAPELAALDEAWLAAFARRIEALGLTVRVSP